MKYDEKKIVNLMQSLDISRNDAIEILQADAEIDKGAKLFELTPEQKAVEKNKILKVVKVVYISIKVSICQYSSVGRATDS